MDLYEVDEDEGNVTVCAQLLEGILERNVTVYLSTGNLTAFGKSHCTALLLLLWLLLVLSDTYDDSLIVCPSSSR